MKNKHTVVVLFALATIVLTLVFLALPGQFVSLIPDASVSKGAMGGYQFIFGGSIEARNMQAHAVDGAALVSAHGIAFLVLLVIAVVCYVFSKKSSALLLLAGIVMLVATILLFAVKGWVNDLYDRYTGSSVGLWVPYLSASLLALATCATFYVAITTLIKEARQPNTPKKQTYSNLKNK